MCCIPIIQHVQCAGMIIIRRVWYLILDYFFSLGYKPIQDNFQHDFARMTDEADSSVVLAELQVALFRECDNSD